jgi:DNA polymerase-3 subunit chi
MAQVDFHSGVTDKLGHACRLLRKVYRAGRLVVVTGPADQLARLDGLLWTFDVGEFIPHARLRSGQAVPGRLARTPIWLAEQPSDVGSSDVLINLGHDVPPGYAQFQRVIEIVSEQSDDAQSGRQRWRHYVNEGQNPTNHPQRGA